MITSPVTVVPVKVAVVVDFAVCRSEFAVVLFDAEIDQPVGAGVEKVITTVEVPVVVEVIDPARSLLPVPIVAPVQVVAPPADVSLSARETPPSGLLGIVPVERVKLPLTRTLVKAAM